MVRRLGVDGAGYDRVFQWCPGWTWRLRRVRFVVLLGANGAEKTTTLGTSSGAFRPLRGSISWDGAKRVSAPHEVRSRGGVVPEGRSVLQSLTCASGVVRSTKRLRLCRI